MASANAFDLYARVRFDSSEFESGLSNAESAFSSFGDKIKSGVANIAKATTAAVAAGAAAVGKIVSESVSAYSSYEQLVGGVQTLFKDNAAEVIANADKAFQTAGMSVNQYMETSIQSAAALISSLGGDTKTAAELMDMSIVDMSDNVNKMGTTMEAVQNAYRGFSRQNFTMLDNLALGFAGTKAGMQDLLDRAKEISGVEYDISSYSDIVRAIHVVQQEMGISGTTAAEASSTIQGSAGSMKAAWENLKVELAKDNGDIGSSIDALVSSATTAFENIEPKIERAMGGVSQLVTKIMPMVTARLSDTIKKIAPDLFKAAGGIVGAVFQGIVESVPDLATVMFEDIVKPLGNSILSRLPEWLSTDIRNIFSSITDFANSVDINKLRDSFGGLVESLEPLAEKLSGGISWAFENVLKPLGTWIANDALPSAIDGLAGAFTILDGALSILETPAKAIWQEFLQPLASVTGDFAAASLDLLGKALGTIADTIEGVDWEGFWLDLDHFWDNWKIGINDLGKNLDENHDAIEDFFGESGFGQKWFDTWEKIGQVVADTVYGLGIMWDDATTKFNAFKDNWLTGIDEIIESIGKLIDKITGLFSGDLGEWVYDKLHPGEIPALGNGGRVTKPTIALIGEKEPETVIPDSKLKNLGGNTINLTVNVEGGISSDYDTDRFIERVATKLADLNILQNRSIGGTGY